MFNNKRSAEEVFEGKDAEAGLRQDHGKKQKKEPPTFANPGALVKFLIDDKEPAEFMIHKEYACYHSSVFDAAFNGPFVEGQTQTYRMNDTTEGAFRLLSQWLYSEKLDLVQLREGYDVANHPGFNFTEENLHLVQLWVLADKILIPRLQDLVLKKFGEVVKRHKILSLTTLKYVYENTAEDSPLRRLLAFECSKLSPESFKINRKLFPHEALIDIVTASSKMRIALLRRMPQIKMADFHVSVGEDSSSNEALKETSK